MPLVAEILKEEVQKIDLNLVKFEILHGDKYVDMWSGGKWVFFFNFPLIFLI